MEDAELVVVGLGTKKNARRGQKSDERDAFALAEQLRTGAIDKRVHKGLGQYGELRELVRAYLKIVEDAVRAKNRLRAMFRSRGISTPRDGFYPAKHRESWLGRLPAKMRDAAKMLFNEHDSITAVRRSAERAMLAEARKHRAVKTVQTCPGIGEIRAAQVVAIIVAPQRFRTKRQLWSYAGLAVVTRSSADWVQGPDGQWERARRPMPRGLNPNHNRTLKYVFKGAATSVITQQKDDPLYRHYQEMLASGVKPNLAKLTVARKIAAIVYAMWKQEEEYDPKKTRRTQT